MCSDVIGVKWSGPIKVIDLAPTCCEAHKVPVRSGRPCLVIDNVFSKEECVAIMAAAKPYHQTEPVSMFPGVRSQFTASDPDLSAMVWKRVKHALPEVLDNGRVIGLQTVWRHARYFPGQSVFAHMDFRHGSREDECVASRLSFTVYLNDDFDGGSTSFVLGMRDDGSHGEEYYPNRPRTGSVVIFYQSVPEFAHTANTVHRSCKSIMRADVMYRFPDKTAADISSKLIK